MVMVNGFTVLQYGAEGLGTFLIPGTSVKLSLRRDVAPLLVAFAQDFDRNVEDLRKGWCWGHSPKIIPGSKVWSNHSWGGAIDLNAPHHPMGKRDTFSANERGEIRALLRKYRHGGYDLFRWGGDYRSRADDMHFELVAPRAVLLDAVKALQAPAKPRPKPKPVDKSVHEPGSRVLRATTPPMVGSDVAFVQAFIGSARAGKADGVFGTTTERGVRWYQRMRGITADGVVGPATWRQMGVR